MLRFVAIFCVAICVDGFLCLCWNVEVGLGGRVKLSLSSSEVLLMWFVTVSVFVMGGGKISL